MIWVNYALLLLTSLPLLLLVHASWQERAWRAAGLGLTALVLDVALWLGFVALADVPGVPAANVVVIVLLAAWTLVSFVFVRPAGRGAVLDSIVRFDERDHMFARNNLRKHPELAARYYATHPEAKVVDERIGKRPELGEPGGRYYDPALTPLAAAAFAWLDRSRHLATGEPEASQGADCESLTRLLLRTAETYGAADAGVVRLRDHHVYARRGRHAEGWGEPIEREHTHALVVVVAMDHEAISHAPDAPVIVESSRQYVESARIAHVAASLLRGFGYRARAHVDGNYEVLCVPLAADAGLGEIGRMSLFMHRVHGPCVRLAVVTTDAPLRETTRRSTGHVEAFCEICKKCSDNCPSRAVEPGAPKRSRGFVHFSVDQEACYGMWRSFGTDCALCIRVCPFSKPDTPVHRLARFYVSRNGLNRRIALWADDLLYGRKVKLPAARLSAPVR